jgi:hypothetical protein
MIPAEDFFALVCGRIDMAFNSYAINRAVASATDRPLFPLRQRCFSVMESVLWLRLVAATAPRPALAVV